MSVQLEDRLPGLAGVREAARRIGDAVRRTPLERSTAASERYGLDVHLKLECWQPTRSFKVRGACNALASLTPAALARGIVTASAGNHGQAVAMAAAARDTRVTVFVPADAPASKKGRIRRFGAALDESATDYDDAERLAVAHAAATGATFVHAFSDDSVVAGQGTIALEVLEQLPSLRTVLVPVGGGGLIAGIGIVMKALSPAVRVIGVQSVETRVMHDSLQAGRVLELPVTPTLADGLAGGIDARSLGRVRAVIDDMVLVEEADIAAAIRDLFNHDGVVAEGSAAVSVAALGRLRGAIEEPVAAIITGGNIDGARLSRVLMGS